MKVMFWLCVLGVFWCYAGFPLLMRLRARYFPRPLTPVQPVGTPEVTVVLAVRNESEVLRTRIENLLSSRYPMNRLQIVVVANGCTDGTVEAARAVAQVNPQVEVAESEAHEGKAGAINAGLERARGEFVVFADARQTFTADTIPRLIEPFSDPHVGGVTGRLVIEAADTPAVEGVRFYWSLEAALRRAESRTGSVIGATGAVYAIRKSLFEPLAPNTILDDVTVPMRIVLAGYRVVMKEDALAYDIASDSVGLEYRRKLRTMVGNIQLLKLEPALLSPRSNPAFGRFLSHKVLRLAMPLAFIGLLVSAAVIPHPLYRTAFGLQAALYVAGLIGLLLPVRILSVPAAFVLVHVAVVEALVRMRSDAAGVWK